MGVLRPRDGLWDILAKSFTPKLYPRGSMIYRQGFHAEEFYYLEKGKIKIFITSENGTEKTLTVKEGGGVFGEAAFFDGLPRVSSAKTIADSAIITITREKMMSCIKKEPQFAMDLMAYLAQTVRMLSAQLDNMTFHNAGERIAGMLLTLSGDGGTVNATQDDMAALAGVSRITVSRVLSGFAKKGWVKTSYRSVTITDKAAVREFASKSSL